MSDHEREGDRRDKRPKRHKRRRDDGTEANAKVKTKEKMKKKKGRKKEHKKEHKSHARSRDDRDVVTEPNYTKAIHVVQELLTETPEIAKDLLELVQMVDDGEVAVIGGIENRRIRAKLKELCPLLGLVKVC